jgi:hypothetical protein
MKRILLASVAAIGLITAVDIAAAQGVPGGGKSESPAAPPSKSDTPAPAPGPGTAQSPSPGGAQSPTATPKAPDQKNTTTDTKQAPQTTTSPPPSKDTKAPTAPAADSKSQTPAPAAAAKDTKAPTTPAADGKNTAGGATGTPAAAAPPPEKRTEIVSSIKQVKVEETTNVNFNISIGASVPTTVRYHPLPSRIIEIYPEWRGYEFILVRGRYIIVEPRTHVIIYIIEG